MTKDEAVQKLSKVARISVAYAEDLYDSFFEKPVVPQCVAKWYEGNKRNLDLNLCSLVFDLAMDSTECYREEFKVWVNDNKKTFITTLVTMHQFGYEVEKEKRYIVKVKGIAEAHNYLNYNTVQKMYSISTTAELGGVYIIKFTRKQLEDAGFGEVFDNPMFEIEEVE